MRRQAGEASYINATASRVINLYLDGVLPLLDKALDQFNLIIGILETIPVAGNLIANAAKLVIGLAQANLGAEISLSKIALQKFQEDYNMKNNAVHRDNLGFAEKFPEKGSGRETEGK